jgi:hypothetical protein
MGYKRITTHISAKFFVLDKAGFSVRTCVLFEDGSIEKNGLFRYNYGTNMQKSSASYKNQQ